MSIKIFLLAALSVTISSWAQENIGEAVGSIDSLANELMQKTHVPGMAIAVVHNSKVIYAKGFGVRKVNTDLKVTPDTVFQIASLSKSISATVIAGLVGRGTVKWDDPVQKYLPDFTLKDPEAGRKVTIREMYSHRSGLPGAAGDDLEVLGCNRTQIIHRLRFMPLNPLGKVYNYSNFAMTTGAEAVAQAASQPWEDLSQRVLYGPLGMNQTSSRFVDYEKRSNKSFLHLLNDKHEWVVGSREPDAQSPAGGVSSTVNDFAKWMIMEMNQGSFHGKQIIDKNSLLQTWEPTMKMPNAPSSAYYGLGIVNWVDDLGQKHLGHSGAFTAGASTTYEMLPAQKLGIVVFTNGMPLGLPEALAKEFVRIYEHGAAKGDRFKELAKVFKEFSEAKKGQNSGDVLSGKTQPAHPKTAPAIAGTYSNNYYGKVSIMPKGSAYEMIINPCGTDNFYALNHKDGNTFLFSIEGNTTELKFHPSEGAKPAWIKVDAGIADELSTLTKVK